MAHHLNTIDTAFPECIRIETGDSERTLQQCLMDALLLITDYSSILWDMAYMKKPVILFQFDRSEFLAERGLHAFSTSDDQMPFVTVVNHRQAVLEKLAESAESRFCLSAEKQAAVAGFFDFFDADNSLRVYNEIVQLLKQET